MALGEGEKGSGEQGEGGDRHEDPMKVLEHAQLGVLLTLLEVEDRAVDWFRVAGASRSPSVSSNATMARERGERERGKEGGGNARETAVHMRNVVSVTLSPATIASSPSKLAVSSATDTVPTA